MAIGKLGGWVAKLGGWVAKTGRFVVWLSQGDGWLSWYSAPTCYESNLSSNSDIPKNKEWATLATHCSPPKNIVKKSVGLQDRYLHKGQPDRGHPERLVSWFSFSWWRCLRYRQSWPGKISL